MFISEGLHAIRGNISIHFLINVSEKFIDMQDVKRNSNPKITLTDLKRGRGGSKGIKREESL